LFFLRQVQEDRKYELILDKIPENTPIYNNVMEQFINFLHIDWYKEGINLKTKEIFDIRYCLLTKRIVFPIHNLKGEIISVKGRYIPDENERVDYNVMPKYLYLYPFYKSIELFNLHRAYEEIKRKKQVIVLESEKATMLATQWGIKNCVSIMGSELSPVQVFKLKQLGLDTELIFMWDKDKNEEFILKQLSQLKIGK
jgi:DNA primase